MTNKLGSLLIRQAPNISHFFLQFNITMSIPQSSLKLFVNKVIRLPQLRILVLGEEGVKYPLIVGDILWAADNLKQFIHFEGRTRTNVVHVYR